MIHLLFFTVLSCYTIFILWPIALFLRWTYRTQNLNEGDRHIGRRGHRHGSILMAGRSWLYNRYHQDIARFEWHLGRRADDLSCYLSFGGGDNDRGVMFHFCIPWIASVFLTIDRGFRVKECKTGFRVDKESVWIYPLPYVMESNTSDPWYRQNWCFYYPWNWNWFSTEVLEHNRYISFMPEQQTTVYIESRKERKKGCVFKNIDNKIAASNSVSRIYPYTYVRKNGEVQKRQATVWVERMTWIRRWPIIPGRMVRTSIDVRFDQEVGEKVDSWKGGCTGCGYEMKPGETPEETLRRMEQERKFT